MSVIREQGLDLEALGLNREELQRRLRQPRNRRYPDAPEQLPAQPLAHRQVLRQRLNEQTRAAANRSRRARPMLSSRWCGTGLFVFVELPA